MCKTVIDIAHFASGLFFPVYQCHLRPLPIILVTHVKSVGPEILNQTSNGQKIERLITHKICFNDLF